MTYSRVTFGKKMLLAVSGFVLAMLGTLLVLREPTEPLTVELLQSAREIWQDAGLRDYLFTYRMHGAIYVVTVQGGIVTAATVDGQSPRSADLGSYSVDGLFHILAEELDNLDDPAGPFAGRIDNIIMRARFNPNYGYVERYLRSSGGYGPGVTIELLGFSAG